jgi:hypothetical protein
MSLGQVQVEGLSWCACMYALAVCSRLANLFSTAV